MQCLGIEGIGIAYGVWDAVFIELRIEGIGRAFGVEDAGFMESGDWNGVWDLGCSILGVSY